MYLIFYLLQQIITYTTNTIIFFQLFFSRREGNNSFISLDTSGKNGTICIVSGVNQAGFIGGEKSENKILIALVGQVIVNIDDDDDSLKNFDDNCSLSVLPSGNNDGRAKVIQGFFCGTVQKIDKEQNQVTILIAPYAREIRKLTRDIDLLKENNSHINALEQQVAFLIEQIIGLKNEKTIHQVQQATKLQPRKTENQSETKENFTCTELGTESKIIETEGAVELRRYQQRIVEQSRNENIIVRLPTGAGKTLVAAEMIRENFQGEFQNLKDKKALMFVPATVLIKQQANEVERWLRKHGVSARVNQFRGGLAFPMGFDVLICTPKAFENAQAKQYENELAWENFSLVIFDEVHHVLKGHPYRKLTTALRNARARTGTNQSNFPRIVGLTASLTYEVDISKIKKSIQILCDELNVTQICQASYQELKDDGYKGTHAKAEVDLVIENELVPKDRGLVSISSREPHLMKKNFESRIRQGTATKYALELWSVVKALEKYAISIDQSCFDSSKPPRISQPLALWETFTHKLATQVIKSSPPLSGVLFELSLWYGALKLLIVSWEEKEYLATSFLQMHNIHQSTMQYTPELTCQIQSFCESFPDTYLRYENLKRILCTEFQKFELDDKKFRGIIFVDQRISTHILKHVLRMDDVTSVLFQPQVVYAAGTPASPRFSLTKSQLASALGKFKTGESNLLIATNVAEEGVDVPAANCVVRFDSMVNSVSLTQSRGRARQANSSFIVMNERSDRTTRDLEAAEETQMQVCENYKCVPKTAEDEAEILELDRLLQRKKEEDSLIKINNRIVNDGDISEANSLALLDIICKETKVDLLDSIGGKPSSVTLTYDSILRKCQTTINIIGNVSKKSQKVAKRKAAKELLEILFSEFSQGL